MRTYVDANVLIHLYLDFDGSGTARDLLTGSEGRTAWPFPVTPLLRFEVINGLQRMVFESRTRGQWRVSPEAAAAAWAEFSEHLDDGTFLQRTPLTLQDIEPEFDALAARHTARGGFRTYDVMHVASARTMRCKRFLSFDGKAKSLAKLEGLKTN